MTDLTVMARFTKSGVLGPGEPATGLTLSDIDLYLHAQHRTTGVDTQIWDGTQHPTTEIAEVGVYLRIYTGADMDTYNYHVSSKYGGIVTLDQHWVNGSVGLLYLPLGTALEWPYNVYKKGTSVPIEGVKVEVHRNVAGNDPIWIGWTDMLGAARDIYGNYPRLDPGTYYFFRKKGKVKFDNPDTEVVS